MNYIHPDLYPFQKIGAEWLASGGEEGSPNLLLADEMGLGKAQPMDALVLTPQGWVAMMDLKVGQFVIGGDGAPTKVVGVFPQGAKDIYQVTFTDGSSTQCCEDHLWLVNTPLRKWRGSQPRVLPLKQIAGSISHANGNLQHFIPMVRPVQFDHQEDLTIDPYLLGALLGDGGITGGTPVITSADRDLIDGLRNVVSGLSLVPHGIYDYRISGTRPNPNCLVQKLRQLGLMGRGSDDKFIPKAYLISSVEQRLAILQGLLDTDGYVSLDSTVQYTSNSWQLVAGVRQIVQSLGGCCRISNKISASGKLHWIATIALPISVKPFRLHRKLKRYKPRTKYLPTRAFKCITYVGVKEAQCIRVENVDGLYVTDNFIVTHNTPEAIAACDLIQAMNILVVCPGIARDNWQDEFKKWQMIPRTTCIIKNSKQTVECNVVIISYQGTMARPILIQLLARDWDVIICDEAHLLKNPRALTTVIMYGSDCDCKKGLGSKAKHVWLLTGTPLPNGPHEMWTHCHALFPKTVQDVGGYNNWVDKFCYWRESNGQQHVLAAIHVDELVKRLRPYVKRRMVKDVRPDMPPLRWGHMVVAPDRVPKMDEAAVEADMVLRAAIASLKHDPSPEELASIINAESMHIASLLKWTGIAKAPAVAEAIRTDLENGLKKLVVFARHTDVFEVLLKNIPGSVAITGKTPEKKRKPIIDSFMGRVAGCDPPVVLLHMDIASTALTLTAASDVAFAETGWVVKDIMQAVKRCHRIGTTRPVLAKVYSLKGSLDEAVSDTIVRKQRLVSQIESQFVD